MLHGIAPQKIVATLNTAMSDRPVSLLYAEQDHTPVGINLQLSESERSDLTSLTGLKMIAASGVPVPVGELIDIQEGVRDKSIYRKNQRRVVYVLADMAGKLESPVYAIMGMDKKIKSIKVP